MFMQGSFFGPLCPGKMEKKIFIIQARKIIVKTEHKTSHNEHNRIGSFISTARVTEISK